MHPLDRPIWQSLSTVHAGLSEGGALAKHMASTTPSAEKVDSKVVPYLYNLEPEHLGTRPLAGLQGKRANKDDTYEMLTSINKSKEKPLPEARLRTGFDKFWPELEAKLRPEALGAGGAPTPPRPNADELLAELVVIVRDQAASIDVVREQIAQVRAAVEPRNFGLLGTGVATPGEKPALASLFQDADLDGFEKYLARRQLKGIARDVVKRINEAEGAEVLPRLREEYLRAKQEEGQQDGEKEPPPKKPRK